MGRRRRPIAMLALALGGFGIGTTEFVSMGLLNLIAADFGITEGQAGTIVTVYAFGVVVGAPLITTLTGRMPRRRLIIMLMAAFIIGNLLTVFTSNYGLLLLSRFIAGFPHGAYFAIANLIAASMAEPGKRGQAVARISLGLATATVVGVPVAQWLGQNLGWNAAYGLVVVIGLLCLAGLWHSVPHMTLMPSTRPSTEMGALINPQVVMTLLAGAVGFGGMFCVYTYISWTMTERAGFPADLMWFVLMVYGIGMVIGNAVGGRLADINEDRSVIGAFVMMIIMLVTFFATSTVAWMAILSFGLLSMGAGILVVNMQARLMDVAGDAQNLAAAMNQAAFNIANGTGAAVGGLVIGAGMDYSFPALAGAGLAVGGLAIFVPAVMLRNRSKLQAA
ncbi:MAG TPA: MFS transporter [Candidatus Corynebacterium avicola]|uniref:MFS transporter n=1 Tax=Candidatus Corynebacterium avicola TaxID=2838527 RepID=A0A9D1UL39_9CORY|nr:MFS transporter [Candidatus Corynebacterium avicola]